MKERKKKTLYQFLVESKKKLSTFTFTFEVYYFNVIETLNDK